MFMSNYMSTKSSIKNLEIQMGQLAKQMAERPTNNFGANTEKNPKKECKVIFTRRENVEKEKRIEEDVCDEEGEKKEEGEKDKSKESGDEVSTTKTKTKNQLAQEARREIPPTSSKEIPYPLVPSKKDKEHYFKQFLDIFKMLEITIPFGEVIQQMPLYKKFLKDILIKKGKYINSETIVVGEYCRALIQKLPPKFKDLGSVTIPCSIGSVSVGKTFIDLGTGINLMSLSMYRRIGNQKIEPTRMTLQLADHSITRSFGVVEDILVKVHQLIFLVDFVIMDIEEDAEIRLILGWPFMVTAKCVVDMGKGNLEMSVEDQKATFNLF
ncbi:hypothetical protein AAZV13_18G131300 [Glycine max]|eukprot:XP_014626784.1 uncharacterized protein LOC102669491 [Glycine max]